MARWGMIPLVVFSQVLLVMLQTPLNIKDFRYSDCRIQGVFHISLQDEYKLTLSQAQDACELFGSVLATKVQVQDAHQEGLETCRYGWVKEGFVVIPRITPMEQCGQNRTGVLTWMRENTTEFDVFCFRQNDAKMNACEPLIMEPTTSKMETPPPPSDPTSPKIIPVFSSETMPHPDPGRTTPPRETASLMSMGVSNRAEKVLWGNRMLYLVLGVLALILLVVFVVALTCYHRKCKCHSFSRRKQPKEVIEAKVWSQSLMENDSP